MEADDKGSGGIVFFFWYDVTFSGFLGLTVSLFDLVILNLAVVVVFDGPLRDIKSRGYLTSA